MELKVCPLEGRDDILVIRVSGEIDSTSAERFREELVGMIGETTRHLVLDLGEVTYINSSGLGALVAAYKRVKASDGSLRLCHVRGMIAKVMELIRLDKMVEMYETEEEALATIR
jgi:anti-sigma B factor antagonist